MNRLFSASILLRGAAAVIGQSLLIRELLVIFYGNELTFGIILSVWLLSGALGSIFAAYLTRHTRSPLALLALIQLFAGIWLVFAIVLVRSSRFFLGVGFGEVLTLLQIIAIAVSSLLVCAFCDGMMFGVAYKAARSVGRVYRLECLGALAAGVFFSLILIKYFTNIQIALFVWIAAAAIASLLLWSARARLYGAIAFLLLCAGIFGLIRSGDLQKATLAIQWRGHDLISYENSVYGNIALTQEAEQRTVYYDGLPMISLPSPEVFFTEDFIHLPMLAHGQVKKVLFLGNAAGGLLAEAEKYPLTSIVYAETDPKLIDVLKRLTLPSVERELSDPRLKVIFSDGRSYLKNTDEKFDAIFINTGLPVSLTINRYYTKEFFAQVKDHLSDDGIAVFKTWGTLVTLSREMALINASLIRTASEVFAHTRVIPGDGYNIFIASRRAVALDAKTLARRLQELKLPTILINPVYLDLRLREETFAWFTENLSSAREDACVNRDLSPCGLYDGLALYYAQFTKKLPRLFGGFRRLTPDKAFAALLVFMLAWSFRARPKHRRTQVLGFTILSSGFFAMGLQVIVIFLFQSYLGYIYQWLAILTASFMTGASLGAAYALRAKNRLASMRNLALIECALATLCGALSLLVIRIIENPAGIQTGMEGWLFCLISASGGLLIGLELPLAHDILCDKRQASTEQCQRFAGWIYGMDLTGACAGALIIPLILIPSCGIGFTILLLWVLKVLNGWIVSRQEE